MKICLLNDSHFGCRSDDPVFADHISNFFHKQFWPYCVKNKITHVIHLGDLLDRRKYVNFQTAANLRRDFAEPAAKLGITIDVILGNHDTFFKNTNSLSGVKELFLDKYDHIKIFEGPAEVTFGKTKILYLPWICDDNREQSLKMIKSTKAQVVFGHLEISGFEMYKGQVIDHGTIERPVFDKFELVASGHFHHRSTDGTIYYLGAQYEITWSDFDDPRGFHIFDTDTRELTYIQNNDKMFVKLFYDDSNTTFEQLINEEFDHLENKYVKVVVKNKTNPHWFDTWVDKVDRAGCCNLQVVEDHLNLDAAKEEEIVEGVEDTLAVVHHYIDALEINDKPRVETLIKNLYNEALSL